MLVVIITVFPEGIAAEEIIRAGDLLTLEKTIETALKYHPFINRDRFIVRQREAIVGQTQSGFYPKVDVSGGYIRTYIERDAADLHYAVNPNKEHSASATLNQLLFDFGKLPADVKSKKFDLESSKRDLESTVNAVTNNAKLSYYSVLKAQRTKDVNLDVVDQFRKHLDVAKIFFEAGKKPKYDVTKAELDLSNAKLELITAENDLKVAWVRLNSAMGIDSPSEYSLVDTFGKEDFVVTLETAVETAYKGRPDLKSLQALKDSAHMAVKRAQRDYFPTFTGKAGYAWIGSETPVNRTWYAGVSMTLNIFEGFMTRNKIEEATARMKSVEAQIASKRLEILLDVKQAYLNLKKAKEKIDNTEIQIRQATENLELANLRYTSGLADPLEVTDAMASYSKAKLANIGALYDYRIELANIEKAMGKQ